MIGVTLKKLQAAEGRAAVTTEDDQRSKKPWNGLDGVDEKHDPYANLRYPFKADLHMEKSQVPASGVASDEIAGGSEKMPPPESGGLPSTANRASPVRGIAGSGHPDWLH